MKTLYYAWPFRRVSTASNLLSKVGETRKFLARRRLTHPGEIEPPLLRRSIQHAEGARYGETKPRSLLDTFTFIHEQQDQL